MRAQVRAARGDHEAALRMLSQIATEAASVACGYVEAAAGILVAIAHARSGDGETAVRTAAPVLALAARTGLFRTITDTGPELARLISSLNAAGRSGWPADLEPVPADYLSRLLVTVDAETGGPARAGMDSSSRGFTPDEPLSAREIDILRLLERGLSNKEIARNLRVTVNTVKWYLKSIYLKLGVARRGEAVAEARRRTILR
jgi:LuxR family maltose regulon positive regulatory protein/serine/threonine-protein kinase PknK